MAKRTTRLGSIAEAMATNKANEAELKKKLDYFMQKITHIKSQVDDDANFQLWPKLQIEQKLRMLESYALSYQLSEIDMECLDEESVEGREARVKQSQDVDDIMTCITVKLNQRMIEIALPKDNIAKKAEKLSVQVQSSTVINTWGTFDGNYAMWLTFRDLFVAGVHKNDNIKPINKFQYLIAACINEAKTALGDWNLSEENYEKAWNRLTAIYEDKYMQVKAFMQSLFNIPKMQIASRAAVRQLIDAVAKGVNGLSRCMAREHIDHFIAFLVIDRMDRETYRSWEKYRQMWIRENAQGEEAANLDARARDFIPKWEHLEKFLENECSIHVHDERSHANLGSMQLQRSHAHSESMQTANSMQNQQFMRSDAARHSMNRNWKQNANENRTVPEHWKCTLCPMKHPIHKCSVFKAMSLSQRRAHMIKQNLCEMCLKPYHGDSKCYDTTPCLPCIKCGDRDGRKFHNSLMCPTREAELQTALLAHDSSGKQRANQSNQSA